MSQFDGQPSMRWSLRGVTEEGDEAWLIRGIARKLYRCPGCHGDIEVGNEHTIVQYVRKLGGTDHHHWHRVCAEEILVPELWELRKVPAGESSQRKLERRGRVPRRAKAKAARQMTRRRRLLGVYVRIVHVYRAWWRPLLVLATAVFLPLGLADALLHGIDTGSLNLTDGLRLGAFVAGTVAVTASSLFGEVFFSGAIAISLTHPEQEEPPTLREIARHVSYLKLIAVDVLYVLAVVVGLFVLVLGAFAAFVYLSLAGPVVELEKHSVWGGFVRSFRLVRGHFWMVAAVVVPIEVVGDALNDGIVGLAHLALGHGLLAAWAGEAVGNIVTAPFFSVAVVLLALDLIAHHDGAAPRLNRRPVTVLRPGAA